MEKVRNIKIFKTITSDEWTTEERIHAISYVLHMKKVGSITPEEFRNAFKWFWDSLADEDKPAPPPKIDLTKYETNKFGIPKLNLEKGIGMQKKDEE